MKERLRKRLVSVLLLSVLILGEFVSPLSVSANNLAVTDRVTINAEGSVVGGADPNPARDPNSKAEELRLAYGASVRLVRFKNTVVTDTNDTPNGKMGYTTGMVENSPLGMPALRFNLSVVACPA